MLDLIQLVLMFVAGLAVGLVILVFAWPLLVLVFGVWVLIKLFQD